MFYLFYHILHFFVFFFQGDFVDLIFNLSDPHPHDWLSNINSNPLKDNESVYFLFVPMATMFSCLEYCGSLLTGLLGHKSLLGLHYQNYISKHKCFVCT